MEIEACEEECEPSPNQERREAKRRRRRAGRWRLDSLWCYECQEPKERRRRGINRYILCEKGKRGSVCMWCVRVCVIVCVACPFSTLSDGDSEFFQHADSFLLVLLPGQPEVVLVLHDVGQHGSAQEHHVLSSRRILDPDLKFLQDNGAQCQSDKEKSGLPLGSRLWNPQQNTSRQPGVQGTLAHPVQQHRKARVSS